ncbi:hypothetical protein GOD74_28880 [Sinorhizobium medicae]|nr:hypothetical protein [Sinorhizobium medicae]
MVALDFIEQSTPRFAISAHRSGVEVLDQSADADIEIDILNGIDIDAMVRHPLRQYQVALMLGRNH